MCGICGIVHQDRARTVDESLVRKMSAAIRHRGPDDDGIICHGNAGFGHRRLSIIDVQGGRQPMVSGDGRYWLVYNGELYNYQPLRGLLAERGHTFSTRSDTEVMLHAYEEYKEACVDHFRGMFAFAVYEQDDSRLFLARDRLGIKPLYYTQVDGSLIFASEIKAILAHPLVHRELDETALYQYLRLRYVPGPRTIFARIYKLQPGHWLVYDQGELRIGCYWDLSSLQQTDDGRRPEELLEEFTTLAEESVRMRMMSEVPLGAFLSGGLDSSVVVALMDKYNEGRPVKTFSVGYEHDGGVNEFAFAAAVARRYQTEHYEYRISAQRFYDFIPDLVWHLDEPIADSACVPLYFLSRFAKQHVTVVLSGEGADEVLAGYGIHAKMLTLEKLRHLPGGLRTGLAVLSRLVLRRHKLTRYLALLNYPLEERYRGVSAAFTDEMLSGSMRFADQQFKAACDSIFTSCFAVNENKSPLNRMMAVDLRGWLPDDLLMKADKMTMAAGQELRVPFLDHKLVEFCAVLPQEVKLTGARSKLLLRQLAQDLLPAEIIDRPKRGFPVPIRRWFEQELRTVARETLGASSAFCRTIFTLKDLNRWLEEHDRGMVDNSELIWNLLVLEFWHREYISASRRK